MQTLTFAYEGLDPQVQYVVRVSVGTRMRPGPTTATPVDPEMAARMRVAMAQTTEWLEADGTPIGEAFNVPRDQVGFFEFDVPKSATQDGSLKITAAAGSELMRGATVSEIWLMKKGKMPWTVKP